MFSKYSHSYKFWIFVFPSGLCSTHLKKNKFDHSVVKSMLLVYLLN